MKLKDILLILDDPEALRIAAAEVDGCIVEPGLPVPNYLNPSTLSLAESDLGLHDRANQALRVRWVNFLHGMIETLPDTPKNKCGSPVVSDIDKLLAAPNIRCAAFILTAHWKKSLTQPAT